MALGSFEQMILIFSTGVGLALLGCVNVFLRRSPSIVRISLSVAVVGVMGGIAWGITAVNQVAAFTGLILGGLLAIQLLAGSDWLASIVAACRMPAVRWGAVGVLGLGAAIASVFLEEQKFIDNVDEEMAELESITAPPPWEVPSIQATTDAGNVVAVREAIAPRSERVMSVLEDAIFSRPGLRDAVIRRAPGSDASNCHGWVFTGSRFWIAGSEVDRIIAENGYQVVTEPRAGDLVVYRSNTGDALHSAVVRYVSDGMPVLVEGKWGASGVYLHAVEQSSYGTIYQYYRSSRRGHLLAGLQSPDSNGTAYVAPAAANPLDPDEFTE